MEKWSVQLEKVNNGLSSRVSSNNTEPEINKVFSIDVIAVSEASYDNRA